MRDYKEQTAYIIAKVYEYEKKKKKRLKLIYSSAISVACISIVVISVSLSGYHQISDTTENVSSPKQESSTNSGVYIPPLELPKTDNGAMEDMIGLIVYNGKIYRQAEYLYGDKTLKEAFVSEYLGTATGAIDERSLKSEYGKEFASSVQGDVYTVNGYDKNFRICIYKKSDGENCVWFFENLNDIVLESGKELYGKSRLNLKGNFSDVVYQLHDDWNNDRKKYKHYTTITNDDINRFIDELYDSPFVDLSEQGSNIYDGGFKEAHLYFKMKDGTTTMIRLFENGYIGYDTMMFTRVFIKMEDDIFKKIFNASI